MLVFSLFFKDERNVNGLAIKPMNILADLEKSPEKKIIKKDSSIVKSKKENCKKGLTCIEDFSGNDTGMDNFLKALTDQKNGPARIGFFGDSFIEGDMMIQDFRDTLQYIFGGQGVGMAPITSAVAGFRQTINHQFNSAWATYSILDSKKGAKIPKGISGHTYIPRAGATVKYTATQRFRFLNNFKIIRFYYSNATENETLKYYLDGAEKTVPLESGSELKELVIKGENIKSIKFEFEAPSENLYVYGVSFEDNKGILVDNFSVRGNSGTTLVSMNMKHLKEMDKVRPYHLIVLQYGLNVANANTRDFTWFKNGMKKSIEHMKEAFPDASFLLVSVPDRSYRKGGEYITMPSIPLLVEAQRELAQETNICFWSLYDGMGGENSMVNFVNSKPRLANTDYTHITYYGGQKIGKAMGEVIDFERRRFLKSLGKEIEEPKQNLVALKSKMKTYFELSNKRKIEKMEDFYADSLDFYTQTNISKEEATQFSKNYFKKYKEESNEIVDMDVKELKTHYELNIQTNFSSDGNKFKKVGIKVKFNKDLKLFYIR